MVLTLGFLRGNVFHFKDHKRHEGVSSQGTWNSCTFPAFDFPTTRLLVSFLSLFVVIPCSLDETDDEFRTEN